MGPSLSLPSFLPSLSLASLLPSLSLSSFFPSFLSLSFSPSLPSLPYFYSLFCFSFFFLYRSAILKVQHQIHKCPQLYNDSRRYLGEVGIDFLDKKMKLVHGRLYLFNDIL